MTDHDEMTIRPQDRMNFGGATINKNDVASKQVVKKNGKETFVINFKNGTKLEYPKQAAKNRAHIISFSVANKPQTYTIMCDFYGASFSGSNMEDNVDLFGCNSCNIDVANDFPKGKKDEQKQHVGSDCVYISEDQRHRSQKNKVTQDANDETQLLAKDESGFFRYRIEGAGTHVEGQEY